LIASAVVGALLTPAAAAALHKVLASPLVDSLTSFGDLFITILD